jgi:succinate dehydrogenase / fumarate reductase membrane anchor subunit
MADPGVDAGVDAGRAAFRTPLARVHGLGPAGHGVEHWWQQRLTAVANVALAIGFVWIVAALVGRERAAALSLVSRPLVALVLALFLVSACLHLRLGLQVVIEDYVHTPGRKIAALIASTFYAVVVAGAGLVALAAIAAGGLR